MDQERIKKALSGPTASIRTPFNEDGSIDYSSLRRMVDFDIQAGSEALLITWGDSLFAILSDREIGDITRAVVEYAGGRAAVVASTGRWATPQTVEFASFVKDIGADILLVFLPMWYPACMNVQTILDHHQAIAKHIPVMANSAEIQRNGASEGLAVARSLIESECNVLAMKADVTGDLDCAMTSLVSDHWTMLAGGKKSFHMELLPYGCQGYLSTFTTFLPEVTHSYWRAISANDIPAAAKIIETIDRPFFEYIINMPGGFDAAMHGITELCGLTKRWRRKPFYSLNDKEMEKLSEFITSLKNGETCESN